MASAIRKPLKKNGRHRSREPRFRQNDEDSASCLGSLNGGVLLVAVRGRNARRAGNLHEGIPKELRGAGGRHPLLLKLCLRFQES